MYKQQFAIMNISHTKRNPQISALYAFGKMLLQR
jgi:hypothetical protein